MILEKRKFIFNTIFMIFEDEKFLDILAHDTYKYSQIIAVTRRDLQVPVPHRDKKTPVIDLTPETDQIFARFSDTTRNEIRKTQHIPDLDIVSEDGNRKEAYNLYKKFEYKGGRVPFAESDLRDCVIFSAYYKKEIISAIYVDTGSNAAGKQLRVRYIFSKRLEIEDRELYKIISNASRRLVWEICQWGKAHSFLSLDLATINYNSPAAAGLTEFKMYFNGQIVPEYTYIYKSPVFTLFEHLVVVKNFVKRLLRV